MPPLEERTFKGSWTHLHLKEREVCGLKEKKRVFILFVCLKLGVTDSAEESQSAKEQRIGNKI